MPYTRDQIDHLLRTNDRAVERAMVRLFELQRSDEQAVARTRWDNDVGFCCVDAKAGTRFARWILGLDDRNRPKFGAKSLTHDRAAKVFGRYCKNGETPLGRARRIALKHSRQLVALANGDLQVLTPAEVA